MIPQFMNQKARALGGSSSFFIHKLWCHSKEQFALFSITINNMSIFKKKKTYILLFYNASFYVLSFYESVFDDVSCTGIG